MKSGENYKSRRTFLKGIAASLLLIPLVQSCKQKATGLLLRLTGTNHILGHRLWAKNFPKPVREIHIPYLIVGGGIAGLSAARQLHKKGITDFLVVELEDHLGGNSSNGENRYSKYPLGAHYLPLPNFQDKELLQFLGETKIITGYDTKGFPVFDEEQLTFSPQERLYYKNSWQEGLVPRLGATQAEEEQFRRFFDKMEFFRKAKGLDGAYLFDIPLVLSSTDSETRLLDTITMQEWMDRNGFTTEALRNYIDYCCRDDYGLGIAYVSAWAGIHYFCGRKHDATSDKKENVLTWAEGNARLASHLKKYTDQKTLKKHLVYQAEIKNDSVVIAAFDSEKQESVTIVADRVILATPQFVNQYLLTGRQEFSKAFHYAPWLLATVTVTELIDNHSYPLCWDNVIYDAKGLGYIYDQHQSLQQLQPKKVITYYHSFSSANIPQSRRELYKQDKEYWKRQVLSDLSKAHPDIEQYVEAIDIHLLGHGMISPVPGFLFGKEKEQAGQSIGNRIYFAHSDLAGISIFEEAFHQGINAVNKMIHDATLDS
ncbi:FAD-dependent oxidoreductase [Flavobacterium sp. CAU 1735]|uniref:FAD-dependent oxidoreductase n=1 Tax=Flavobacterium sp. CAU 1735 TaxID=3140361 RepID=UPI003260837B